MLGKHVVHEINPYANISMKDEVCSALIIKYLNIPSPKIDGFGQIIATAPLLGTHLDKARCFGFWEMLKSFPQIHLHLCNCATLCQGVIEYHRIIESYLWYDDSEEKKTWVQTTLSQNNSNVVSNQHRHIIKPHGVFAPLPGPGSEENQMLQWGNRPLRQNWPCSRFGGS